MMTLEEAIASLGQTQAEVDAALKPYEAEAIERIKSNPVTGCLVAVALEKLTGQRMSVGMRFASFHSSYNYNMPDIKLPRQVQDAIERFVEAYG